MEPTPAHSPTQLRSELARLCLPSARRDANRKLAWTNSICFLFLVVGVTGLNPVASAIKKPPPLEQTIPVVIPPDAPPPTRIEARSEEKPADHSQAARVVAVVAPMPAIHFSVPTIGNLVVPLSLAAAPPPNPLAPLIAARNDPTAIQSTGTGGERPDPPYPPMAKQMGQQGTVVLLLTVDANGSITNATVKLSSGSSVLDHSTLEFMKRHWLLPAGDPGHVFEAPIHFVLSP